LWLAPVTSSNPGEQRHAAIAIAILGVALTAALSLFPLGLDHDVGPTLRAVGVDRWTMALATWALFALPGAVIYYQQRLIEFSQIRAATAPATSGSWSQAGGLFLLILEPVAHSFRQGAEGVQPSGR
jgi:hypothetical protein